MIAIPGPANQRRVPRTNARGVDPHIVTGLEQNVAPGRDIPSNDHGWAPRLAQESRLRQLDELLARPAGTADAIENRNRTRVLLGALNRQQDAQQAFVDILRRAPEHFSALNEFGTLLTNMGAIDAACRSMQKRSLTIR